MMRRPLSDVTRVHCFLSRVREKLWISAVRDCMTTPDWTKRDRAGLQGTWTIKATLCSLCWAATTAPSAATSGNYMTNNNNLLGSESKLLRWREAALKRLEEDNTVHPSLRQQTHTTTWPTARRSETSFLWIQFSVAASAGTLILLEFRVLWIHRWTDLFAAAALYFKLTSDEMILIHLSNWYLLSFRLSSLSCHWSDSWSSGLRWQEEDSLQESHVQKSFWKTPVQEILDVWIHNISKSIQVKVWL